MKTLIRLKRARRKLKLYLAINKKLAMEKEIKRLYHEFVAEERNKYAEA